MSISLDDKIDVLERVLTACELDRPPRMTGKDLAVVKAALYHLRNTAARYFDDPVMPCGIRVGAAHFHAGIMVCVVQGAIDRMYERMRRLEQDIGYVNLRREPATASSIVAAVKQLARRTRDIDVYVSDCCIDVVAPSLIHSVRKEIADGMPNYLVRFFDSHRERMAALMRVAL